MAIVAFTGFETGDFSEWASTNASPTVQTTIIKTGSYALKSATTAQWVRDLTGMTAQSTWYTRFYFQVTTLPAAATTFMQIGNIANSAYYLSLNTDGTIQVSYWVSSIETVLGSSTTALATGTWYLIETKYVIAAVTGICELKINGNIEVTGSNLITGTTAQSRVNLGNSSAGSNIDKYYDDFAADTAAYIGAGQCIARQGKAGTPNYGGWTKNGGTIDVVWSETPFGATNNAVSPGTGDPLTQSMLTAAFSSGTNPIGTNDTINACKTSVIAQKSGGAGRTHQILRRLNGVDTLTTISTGNSDGYFEDTFFTDTLTNLDAAEIGGKKSGGAGASSMTIEDCWLMVDYTPAVANIPTANDTQSFVFSST